MILYKARKIRRAAEAKLLTDGLQRGFGGFNHLARGIKRGLGLHFRSRHARDLLAAARQMRGRYAQLRGKIGHRLAAIGLLGQKAAKFPDQPLCGRLAGAVGGLVAGQPQRRQGGPCLHCRLFQRVRAGLFARQRIQ